MDPWTPAILVAVCCIMAGCTEPGDHGVLTDSGTECADGTPVAEGFHVRIANATRLVGRCMTIAHDDASIDHPFAERKVAADGTTWLPIAGAGRYYMTASANEVGDPYCQLYAGEFVRHSGEGIVEVVMETGTLCT